MLLEKKSNVINEEGILNLFKLTKKEYFADFFITPPLTLLALIFSLVTNDQFYLWPVLFGTGLFLWSFYEYMVHRFISHKFWLFRRAHFLHHANQKDYIAVPPAFTIITYFAFWWVFGFNYSTIMTGFSSGYVIYSIMHTLYHYKTITKRSFLHKLHKAHILHHRYGNVNYGVTSPFWDRVFGTFRI